MSSYRFGQALTLLYNHPLNNRAKPTVKGTMIKTPLTGVDSTTAILLSFDGRDSGGLSAQAMLSCSIHLPPPDTAVTVRFERGIIEIPAPIHNPRTYILKRVERGKIVSEEMKKIDFVGAGLHFQVQVMWFLSHWKYGLTCACEGGRSSTLCQVGNERKYHLESR